MRSVVLIALILLTASCTNGAGDEADQLSQILEPTTTLATTSTTSTVTSTTAASTTSTTTTSVIDSSETTNSDSTEVLSDVGAEDESLEELPLTGGELTVALAAVSLLLLGVWLIRRARAAQTVVDRIHSNLWRRLGSG